MRYTWGDAEFATNPNGNLVWANEFGWWVSARKTYEEVFPTTGETLAVEEVKFNETATEKFPAPRTTDYPDISFR